jgi:hypothetical protein
MPDEPQSLPDAVEALHAVFGRHSASLLNGYPPCCSAEHERFLASQPLRQLTADDLHEYAARAMTTVGSADDFKHFLPRLFELLAIDGEREFQVESLLGKLAYGQWNHWPQREHKAVESFLRALWKDLLSRHPYTMEADTLLCGIGNAMDDLSPYLVEWAKHEHPAASLHLADFILANEISNHPRPPGLRNPFWQGRETQGGQVLRWLLDPARAVQLERAFFNAPAPDAQQVLSDAIAEHERLRQRAQVVGSEGAAL